MPDLFKNEDGTPTPPCSMCGNPRMRKRYDRGLHLYCGPRGCEAPVRICQRPGCGEKFAVAPGARKYCPAHSVAVL